MATRNKTENKSKEAKRWWWASGRLRWIVQAQKPNREWEWEWKKGQDTHWYEKYWNNQRRREEREREGEKITKCLTTVPNIKWLSMINRNSVKNDRPASERTMCARARVAHTRCRSYTRVCYWMGRWENIGTSNLCQAHGTHHNWMSKNEKNDAKKMNNTFSKRNLQCSRFSALGAAVLGCSVVL